MLKSVGIETVEEKEKLIQGVLLYRPLNLNWEAATLFMQRTGSTSRYKHVCIMED